MRVIKGKLEATISLNKSTCYFLKTGQCSLGVAADFYLSPGTRLQPSDLLYCPSLRRAMEGRGRLEPVPIFPCECGHAEVVSGQQRACIASQTGLELAICAAGDEGRDACKICGTDSAPGEENAGGDRIVTIKALIYQDDE